MPPCKEIEENNRMGKITDLFKKIRDTKGTFHANMGSIKDRNAMDLTEAEDIKKRWQEYTEELFKEQCGDSLKNCKQNYLMTQQSHCWAYTPRKPELKETHVPQCSSGTVYNSQDMETT